jgi:hypothetical protein
MLSTSTIPPPKLDEPSDGTERKWRSDFWIISRSLAPFSSAERRNRQGGRTRTQCNGTRTRTRKGRDGGTNI